MTDFKEFDPQAFQNLINLALYKGKKPAGLTIEYIMDAKSWLNTDEGEAYIRKVFDYLDKKPEPEPEPEPEQTFVRQYYTKQRKMGVDRIHSAYYFPKEASEYGCKKMKFVWSDGNSMVINDPTKDTIIDARDGRRFHPTADPDPRENPGMAVYAKQGTKPDFVDMYCLQD